MEKGCSCRKICDAYSGKYYLGKVLSLDFKKYCDSASEEILKGACPIYDIYSEMFGIMSERLKEANKDLGNVLRRYDGFEKL